MDTQCFKSVSQREIREVPGGISPTGLQISTHDLNDIAGSRCICYCLESRGSVFDLILATLYSVEELYNV